MFDWLVDAWNSFTDGFSVFFDFLIELFTGIGEMVRYLGLVTNIIDESLLIFPSVVTGILTTMLLIAITVRILDLL